MGADGEKSDDELSAENAAKKLLEEAEDDGDGVANEAKNGSATRDTKELSELEALKEL